MSAATSQPSQAEMGAQLQKAAYTEPPIVPKGLAMSLIIVVLISAIIATIIIALRVLVRGWISRKSKVWGWEDTFAVLGYVSAKLPLIQLINNLRMNSLLFYVAAFSLSWQHTLVSVLEMPI